MGWLIAIEDFDNFKEIRGFPPGTISNELQEAVRNLDEREELEPFIRSILFDSSDTPHGPVEMVAVEWGTGYFSERMGERRTRMPS